MSGGDDRLPIASIVWHLAAEQSHEHATLSEAPDGATLTGRTVLVVDGQPCSIVYTVDLDRRWRTRTAVAEIHIGHAPPQRFALEAVDGIWLCDGGAEPALDGCVDVDLGWTPATNLLPIRRTELAVGETVEIDAVWLRFPELELVRSTQRYTRRSESVWRYESGAFSRDLTVNQHGFVTAYGDDLWQAVAASP